MEINVDLDKLSRNWIKIKLLSTKHQKYLWAVLFVIAFGAYVWLIVSDGPIKTPVVETVEVTGDNLAWDAIQLLSPGDIISKSDMQSWSRSDDKYASISELYISELRENDILYERYKIKGGEINQETDTWPIEWDYNIELLNKKIISIKRVR